MSHLLAELALDVLGPRGAVDGRDTVKSLAAKADGVAHLLLVDALKHPVSKMEYTTFVNVTHIAIHNNYM